MEKIKVLIVDDSAVVRQALSMVFASDKNIEVIGTAADPYYAAQKIQKEIPDVITLDIEMPRMDGLTFLKKLMSQHPIPVVIISSLTANGTETGMKALEYGAVDIITKPQLSSREFYEESRIRLCDVVKAAANAKLSNNGRLTRAVPAPIKVEPKYSADAVMPESARDYSMIKTTEIVIAIGASTGGTEALKELLEVLPADTPGIVIVQHMPEVFTRSFAQRLNEICKISVKEAENGDTVIRGRALIAPGNKHTLLKRSGA
ncbi:MAG: chemotaxis-specific protein-glutamate methyltransferase CheB, partial [Bacteroidota bacterium]